MLFKDDLTTAKLSTLRQTRVDKFLSKWQLAFVEVVVASASMTNVLKIVVTMTNSNIDVDVDDDDGGHDGIALMLVTDITIRFGQTSKYEGTSPPEMPKE